MSTNTHPATISFLSVTWPIFIDTFLRMFVILISYWIISRVSDAAAGVMGVTNLCILMGFILVECLAQSSAIAINQYLGARQYISMSKTYVATIVTSLIFGIFVSLLFLVFSKQALSSLGFSGETLKQGSNYLNIVGSGFFIYSLGYAFMYILNSNGFTRFSMLNSLLVNGLSLGLSYFIITYGMNSSFSVISLLGWANVIVRILGMLFLGVMTKLFVKDFLFYKKVTYLEFKEQFLIFVKLGLPNMLEPLSYYAFQIVLIKIIASIDIDSLATRTYVITIAGFFEIAALSISKGNQIVMGHMIGGKKYELAKKQLMKSISWAFFLSLIIATIGLLFRFKLMHFFSNNSVIVNVGAQLIVMVSIITILRAFNFNLSGALKSAGDVRFCVTLIMISTWLVAMPGSYFLVKYFRINLLGIWIMLGCEELVRLIFFRHRWISGKWEKYALTDR